MDIQFSAKMLDNDSSVWVNMTNTLKDPMQSPSKAENLFQLAAFSKFKIEITWPLKDMCDHHTKEYIFFDLNSAIGFLQAFLFNLI
jgi:hypothetical protein